MGAGSETVGCRGLDDTMKLINWQLSDATWTFLLAASHHNSLALSAITGLASTAGRQTFDLEIDASPSVGSHC